jgi:three-Cys-motif partner protein
MKKGGYRWNPDDPDQLDDHSFAKHSILKAYLRRYLEVLTKNFQQRELTFTVVDGFAGGNLYKRNGLLVPGSPGIFIDTVKTVEQEIAQQRPHGFTIKVDFFFIETGRRPRELLQDTIRSGPFASDIGNSIHIRGGSFVDHADEIIKRIQAKGTARRSLFLLDQYGWGKVPVELVRRIMTELDGAEVFLTFAVDALITYLTDKTSELNAAARIGLTDTVVQQLLGMGERGGRALVQHGLYEHLREEVGARHATPFFLHSLASGRSLWFVHFSKSWRARDEIGQIHWNAAQGLVDHRGDPGFHSLGFTPERVRDPNQFTLDFAFDEPAKKRTAEALTSQIPSLVETMTRSGGPPTLRGIFENHGGPTPVTLPMLRQHLAQMHEEKELTVRASNGKERRAGVFIKADDTIERAAQRRFFFMRSGK